MRRTFAGLGALVAGLVVPGLAAATIVVPQTLEQMARESAAVVRAKVVQRQSAWDDDHRRIHTYAELQVLEAVHGQVEGSLVVRTLGGEVGEIGMRVSGTPSFRVGEEVFVFLRADPTDAERFQVVGMSQGKYTVDRSGATPMAVASTAGLAFATRKPTGDLEVAAHADDDRALPLPTLVARVKAALQAPRPTAPTAPTAPAIPHAPAPTAPAPSTTVTPD